MDNLFVIASYPNNDDVNFLLDIYWKRCEIGLNVLMYLLASTVRFTRDDLDKIY